MSDFLSEAPGDFSVEIELIGARYAYENAGPAVPMTKRQCEARKAFIAQLEENHYAMVWRPCLVCDGKWFAIIALRDRYDLPVPTCICRECGLVQANPRMRPGDYEDFYATLYRDLYVEETLDLPAFFKKQERIGKRIRQYLADDVDWRPPTRILEVGTGAGGTLDYLCRDGARGIGIDFDESYLAFGRKRWLDLRRGAIGELDISVRPDLIVYRHVLEHLDDPVAELKRASALCRRGKGMLYVEVPGVDAISTAPSRVGGDLLKTIQNAHTYYFSRKSLANVLMMGGFRIRRIDEQVRSLSIAYHDKARKTPKFREDWRAVLAGLRAIEERYQAGADTDRETLSRPE
ncbi:MAG: class I SAM-dependent methyltransferase [Parasphingopyxis sp.]|uniref:class I SAM-dependent methyltransferase n=1 Tax=Parasphingopyxis sp. TaxID=1920299 RepID=UPI003FA0F95E